MKRYGIAILRPVVKGLYRLIRKGKRSYRPHAVLMSGRLEKPALPKAGPDKDSRSARNKRLPIWKNKRGIIAAGAAAVVLAVTLGVVLPAPQGQAEVALRAALPPAVQGAAVLPVFAASTENAPSPLSKRARMPEAHAEPVPATSPEDLTADIPEASPVPTIAPEAQALVPGCDDPRIAEVQTRLMELGYMGEDEPTNHYGYGTEYALQLFQRKHALQVDGLLGEKTMAALFSDEAQPYTVKLGDRGTDVESIQEQLIELKYLKTGSTGYNNRPDFECPVQPNGKEGLPKQVVLIKEGLESPYHDTIVKEHVSGAKTGQ